MTDKEEATAVADMVVAAVAADMVAEAAVATMVATEAATDVEDTRFTILKLSKTVLAV